MIGTAAVSTAMLGASLSVMRQDNKIRSALPNMQGLPPQNWRERAMTLFQTHNPNPADVEKQWEKKSTTDKKTARLNSYRKMGKGKKALIAGGIIGATGILGAMYDEPNS